VSLYAVMCDYFGLFHDYLNYCNYLTFSFFQTSNNWNNREFFIIFIIDFRAFWSIK
jgi:hypothetical protein